MAIEVIVEMGKMEILGIILTLLALSTIMLIIFVFYRKLILFTILLAIGVIIAMIGGVGKKSMSIFDYNGNALLIILGAILSLFASMGMWYYVKFKL